MKRFLPEVVASGFHAPDAMVVDEAVAPTSFKRMRLTTSPGELRLEGDLRNMTSWTRVDNRHWVSKKGDGALLERQFASPMTFVLYLSQHTQVSMEFPRQYPHEPPKVTSVVHPFIHDVNVSIQPATMSSSCYSSSDATIVYDQWSAVRRLDDFLGFLVEALKHHPRNLVTPTLMSDGDEEMEMDVASCGVEHELSPNRFDRGYPKEVIGNMPRGELERDLMNSGSY